jgi:hypothetical protein
MKVVDTSYKNNLQSVMDRLGAIAGALNSEGLEDEAQSLKTTIADLEWQCEELSEREPAQSRRPPTRVASRPTRT